MTGPGALLLGGDYRALGIARSLGRRGIPVWAVQQDDRVAGTSRFVRRRLTWPGTTDEARIAFLEQLAATSEASGWVLFPTTDESATLVSRFHDRLADTYPLTTSPIHVHESATNKEDLYRRAQTLGIAHPRTSYPTCADDLAKIDLEFPMILKPSVRRERNEFTDAKAWRVDSIAELRTRYEHACSLVDPADVMIQELIPGAGECQVSFACVCRDGVPVASLTATRRRQYPIDFGRSSTFVVSADHPDVVEPSLRLLGDLGLSGPVEIEYKLDRRDGSMKVLDVNARVWGWHSIGHAAGVDFAYIAWLVAQGSVPPSVTPRAGIRWVRFSTDIPAVLQEVRSGRSSWGDYFRSIRPPLEGPLAAFDDPLPMLAEVPIHLLGVARRRLRRST